MNSSAPSSPGCALPPLRSRFADNPRLRPIVEKFGERLAQRMTEFERADAAGDLEQLAQLAHWLRGAAGTVGYPDFTQPSLALEAAAKAQDRPAARTALDAVRALAARVTAAAVTPANDAPVAA